MLLMKLYRKDKITEFPGSYPWLSPINETLASTTPGPVMHNSGVRNDRRCYKDGMLC
jgi:hypothetical protein